MGKTVEVKVIDIVKGTTANLMYAEKGKLFYKVENDTHVYIFPVDFTDIEDVGETRFEVEYKAVTLMRYINKAIKKDLLVFYKK